MDFLLAFVVTGLAATGGWLVWGVQRGLRSRRQRRHELALARERELTERARLQLRARELDDQIYRDFAGRQTPGLPPPVDPSPRVED